MPRYQHSGYNWQTRTRSAAPHPAAGGEAPCALDPLQAKLPEHPEPALAIPAEEDALCIEGDALTAGAHVMPNLKKGCCMAAQESPVHMYTVVSR